MIGAKIVASDGRRCEASAAANEWRGLIRPIIATRGGGARRIAGSGSPDPSDVGAIWPDGELDRRTGPKTGARLWWNNYPLGNRMTFVYDALDAESPSGTKVGIGPLAQFRGGP
jgi:hypothetical protein